MRDRSYLPDTIFLAIVGLLVSLGAFVFMSASFGLLARSGAGWGSVLFSQFALGIGGGLVCALIAYHIPLHWLRRYSFYIFIAAIIATLLVFVPGIGFRAGGAARWIHILGQSVQPSELLKVGMILFLASWLGSSREEVASFKYGFLPFVAVLSVVAGIMLAQPDTGTFLVMAAAAVGMFLAAGGRIKHLLLLAGVGVLLIGVLALTRPYVRARITTFINPSADPLGESYQIRQSLIAIGGGGITGRGFGGSVQKYQYLPEPIGDSIYAVLGEEFGLMGTLLVLLLFFALCLRGLRIAGRAPDRFSGLLVTGLVIMITSQAFLNMGALIGLLPLTGIPLPFVSHGGTAMMTMLVAVSLILSASRKQT